MSENKKIFLKDYKAPNYYIEKTHLTFDIYDDKTIVTQESLVTRNSLASAGCDFVLQGENLKLIEVSVDGAASDYSISKHELTMTSVPETFGLKIITEIEPHNNTALEGLYKSGDIFCTQCEAEGFRRITYFVDRPDNMAMFSTTITADKIKYPTLLSNGNLVDKKELQNGRHQVTWEDPFKKPCYLFALVAGDLDLLQDEFVTKSGRKIDLRIYVDKGRLNRTDFAMESLKKSMKWDEERFNLEYDLDIFMIVAVDAFNMGAMENKGLNIFNSKYILANQETATDDDYESIEAVIGHEYFHNWTGNRVTCRDWFQLSLKEGLTVYRDQEFTSDLRSRPVKRLQDVSRLRNNQFVEDAGPNAHPVRPQFCVSMDNLYTLTIYEKGSEVIRMIEKIVGKEGFKKGISKYFELFDGQAVTTEDFVMAMEKANDIDLTQFKNWYDQAGTPELEVNTHYNPQAKTFQIIIKQSTPPTPETETKKPFHIPFEMGLMDNNGKPFSLNIVKSNAHTQSTSDTNMIIELKDAAHEIIFGNVESEPTPSFLRDFSAPVKVAYSYSADQLLNLIKNDSDSFNQWNAAQNYYRLSFNEIYKSLKSDTLPTVKPQVFELFKSLLSQSSKDPQFYTELLSLPKSSYLEQFFNSYDPTLVTQSLLFLKKEIAKNCESSFLEVYKSNQQSSFNKDGLSIGQRSLSNLALSFLTQTEKAQYYDLAKTQFNDSFCMTNTLGAMVALNDTNSSQRTEVFNEFYQKWKSDPNVINNWLKMESLARRPKALEHFQDNVLKSEAYDENIPNKIYNTLLAFSHGNKEAFHEKSGEGYRFIADQIIDVDGKNPQVASRLCSSFNMWKKWGDDRGEIIEPLLKKIVTHQGLSKNSFEIINNALK